MLNKIEKGMSNAAEKINENFEEIDDYIIEQGDNYKGRWEKWASGKLVQYGSLLKTHEGIQEEWGAIYLSDPVEIVYPIPFWDIYTLNVNLLSISGATGWLFQYKAGVADRLIKSPAYTIARPSRTSATIKVQYDFKAIGLWKQPDGWDG